jgi:hypothetical protein
MIDTINNGNDYGYDYGYDYDYDYDYTLHTLTFSICTKVRRYISWSLLWSVSSRYNC